MEMWNQGAAGRVTLSSVFSSPTSAFHSHHWKPRWEESLESEVFTPLGIQINNGKGAGVSTDRVRHKTTETTHTSLSGKILQYFPLFLECISRHHHGLQGLHDQVFAYHSHLFHLPICLTYSLLSVPNSSPLPKTSHIVLCELKTSFCLLLNAEPLSLNFPCCHVLDWLN